MIYFIVIYIVLGASWLVVMANIDKHEDTPSPGERLFYFALWPISLVLAAIIILEIKR